MMYKAAGVIISCFLYDKGAERILFLQETGVFVVRAVYRYADVFCL